jgi:release factor glutamine methyltransferase
MHTIESILKATKHEFKEYKIPSYSLDADLLMAYALKTTREHIFCNPKNELSQSQVNKFNQLVKRRISREPMSHILGTREFWGIDFKVTQDTLDPRPDSECLIEQVLDLFKNNSAKKTVLDLGTGTGCLLLTLLTELQSFTGTGIDISEGAIRVAKSNSEKLGLAKRTSFVVSNWDSSIKNKYDLIISNPPYIKSSDIEGLEPEVSTYEPKQALDGGNDGLMYYTQLAPIIFNLLPKGGFAVLEHGIGQETEIRKILENNNLTFVSYKKDLAGINRCITVKK